MSRNRVLLVIAAALLLGGCAAARSLWPFGGPAAVAQVPVTELALRLPPDGVAPVVLQYWERDTLVIDLTAVGSAGGVTLLRQEGRRWPARIGFRMAPRRFEVLEVRGAQRAVLPVSAGDAAPTTAVLAPGVFDDATGALEVRWGVSGAF